MRELTLEERNEVSGGIGPLAIIAIDLALNAAFMGAVALHMQYQSNYRTSP